MSSSTRHGARLIYAAGEQCANMLYASGLMTPDPYLWFSCGEERGVVVNVLEFGRAKKQVKSGTAVLSFEDARTRWALGRKKLTTENMIAGFARCCGLKTLAVPADFPLGLAQRVEKKGVTLKALADFFPERRRKSLQEVEYVREGVRLAERGLRRGLQILRQSSIDPNDMLVWEGKVLTSERLVGEIAAEIARHGGTGSHTIAAPGCQGADPHQTGHGPIRAHEPIVLDIFPRVDRTGYHGDLTRTVVKGRAPDIVRKAFNAVQAAQKQALDRVRGGVKASVVHHAACQKLTEAGFRTDTKADPPRGFIHGLGHGLGLEIHEAPRLGSQAHALLVEGDVVTIEPGLYDPEWGGVRIEDVVVVTPEGCENLTSAGVFLEIE